MAPASCAQGPGTRTGKRGWAEDVAEASAGVNVRETRLTLGTGDENNAHGECARNTTCQAVSEILSSILTGLHVPIL